MENTASIARRIGILREQVAQSCRRAGRSADSVRIIAVAKTFPAAAVRAALDAGLPDIGENYLQESLEKIRELGPGPAESGKRAPDTADAPAAAATWHFIGKLQSNKTRPAAAHFDWVHTVDSASLARRLSDAREGMPPLNICLQVNIDDEDTKNGVPAGKVIPLAGEIAPLANLRLRGLMALPRPNQDDPRAPFRALAALAQSVSAECGLELDTLSMGMSADFDAAIAEGATHIRIGTAIFGERAKRGVN